MYLLPNLRRIPLHLGLAGLVLVVGVLTTLVAMLDPSITPNLATGATVTASSGDTSSKALEHLIDGDIWHIGYQTNSETNPWIRLEFREPTLVSRIVIHNRVDCCWAQAVPLTLQLAAEDGSFKDVASISTAFDKWNAEFAPRRARYLRVQLKRTGALVLNEIEVL